MATLVMKFGGSLTADAQHLRQVGQIIAAESQAWDHLVVVVSAMAGITDALRRAGELALASHANGYRRAIAVIRERHLDLLRDLFANPEQQAQLVATLDQVLFDALNTCDQAFAQKALSPRQRDALMATGELIMAGILTQVVRNAGLVAAHVPAESLIITDDAHQHANPIADLIEERVDRHLRPLLEQGVLPIVPGFVGATRKGVITTLGRGGSDYTATLLAAALRADEVWIWTNVDGIMSSDPDWVPHARVIPALSYAEIEELAYFGTRVLHPDAIEPLVTRAIPLRVRNPANPDHAGTLIHAESDAPDAGPKAVSAVDGISLVLDQSPLELGAFLGQVQHLVGSKLTGPVIVMQGHHHTTLVYVVPTSEGANVAQPLATELALHLPHWQVQPVKVIAVVGASIALNAALSLTPIASVVGPGNRRLLAVAPEAARETVRQLHSLTGTIHSDLTPRFAPRP
jgi:aspartate kinase